MKPLLEALAERPLLWDGAMGTLLYERGVFLTRSFDELNVSSPALIQQIHREYVAAGADVIETNTFTANRLMLARHAFDARFRDINEAGVKLAQEAARGRNVYVAGAVGPSGIDFDKGSAEDRARGLASLAEQIDVLVETGVDLILLETFYHVTELEQAIAVAREHGRGLPIVAQAVFGPTGHARNWLSPADVARRLAAAGADVIGANCGTGPAELYDVAVAFLEHGDGRPVSIQANAGHPRVVEGRTLYVANAENFGVFARRLLKKGVRMVGGCCGTTPEHTRHMLGAVRMLAAGHGGRADSEPPGGGSPAPVERKPVVPFAERSTLASRLAAGKFAVSCELLSPVGVDPDVMLGRVRKLKELGGAHLVNIADGPRAIARMGNLAACALVQQSTGVETILHVCCRDRNLLGLIAHLLAAQALGIRNLVIITGDPPKMGDYPHATPVYDVDSIELLRIAAGMNAGVDPAGKQMESQTSFVLATGAEPGALDYDRELQRLEEKKKAGAELVMTQPVYDPEVIARFLDDTRGLGLPILVGLLPLASHRNAEFLHNEVPGMRIPKPIRDRMKAVGSGPEARAEGVRIAQEALASVHERVAGAYIMPPFDRVESAAEILKVLPPGKLA